MTQPFDTLNLQHQNINRLITLVEREIDVVEHGGMPRVAMLKDIMQYVTHYVDVTRQPFEERLIERAHAVGGAAKADLAECRRQHETAVDRAREFTAIVEAVTEEQLVERTAFVRIGRDFVDAQRLHIALEEDTVFPALRRALGEDELETVGDAVEHARDPLIGGIVEREYRQLYDYILRSA